MRVRIIVVFLCLALCLVGCATYAQLMVGPNGDIQSCSSTGRGIIGMATASDATSTCADRLRSAGYLEIERAGVIGIRMSDSLRVLTVAPASPADTIGIVPGDVVTAINGQRVTNNRDAQILLFGPAGSYVTVRVLHEGVQYDNKMIRAPYTQVFGGEQPKKAKKRTSALDWQD